MAYSLNPAHLKFSLLSIASLAVVVTLLIQPYPVLADEAPVFILPDLPTFSQSVQNGQSNELRGVYVPQVLAMPIVQQPAGNAGYVSGTDGVITEFRMAADMGNVGLLAHNTLAGASFSGLMQGQDVTLIYGDGHRETFVITAIVKYQALDPYSPYSEFRDLQTGLTITASDLFEQVYRGERHITFQTCIEAEGNPSWGRLFVMAEPKVHAIADFQFRLFERVR